MVFGTFDGFHPGHHFFLETAGKLADDLIAVVASDNYVELHKGTKPHHNQAERIKSLLESDLVSMAVPADKTLGSWIVVSKYQPDIVCLGHDQVQMERSLRNWIRTQDSVSFRIEVLPAFKREKYSSTLLRKRR